MKTTCSCGKTFTQKNKNHYYCKDCAVIKKQIRCMSVRLHAEAELRQACEQHKANKPAFLLFEQALNKLLERKR